MVEKGYIKRSVLGRGIQGGWAKAKVRYCEEKRTATKRLQQRSTAASIELLAGGRRSSFGHWKKATGY